MVLIAALDKYSYVVSDMLTYKQHVKGPETVGSTRCPDGRGSLARDAHSDKSVITSLVFAMT